MRLQTLVHQEQVARGRRWVPAGPLAMPAVQQRPEQLLQRMRLLLLRLLLPLLVLHPLLRGLLVRLLPCHGCAWSAARLPAKPAARVARGPPQRPQNPAAAACAAGHCASPAACGTSAFRHRTLKQGGQRRGREGAERVGPVHPAGAGQGAALPGVWLQCGHPGSRRVSNSPESECAWPHLRGGGGRGGQHPQAAQQAARQATCPTRRQGQRSTGWAAQRSTARAAGAHRWQKRSSSPSRRKTSALMCTAQILHKTGSTNTCSSAS